MKRTLLLVVMMMSLSACQASGVPTGTAVPTNTRFFPTPTFAASPTPPLLATESLAASSTPDTRLRPEQWQDWPVVPQTISPRTLAIYQAGQSLGNDPHAFRSAQSGASSLAALNPRPAARLVRPKEPWNASMSG